jgi:hypothetical protein
MYSYRGQRRRVPTQESAGGIERVARFAPAPASVARTPLTGTGDSRPARDCSSWWSCSGSPRRTGHRQVYPRADAHVRHRRRRVPGRPHDVLRRRSCETASRDIVARASTDGRSARRRRGEVGTRADVRREIETIYTVAPHLFGNANIVRPNIGTYRICGAGDGRN